MYCNVARFKARTSSSNTIIELADQDKSVWNQNLINKGIECLNKATKEDKVSVYLILATISANHCIAKSFDRTNWKEIRLLYNQLILIENSPMVGLNRTVTIAEVEGIEAAIKELKIFAETWDMANNYLFHATLAEFYKKTSNTKKAIESYKKAILLAKNKRDTELLKRKLIEVVPI